MAGPARGGEEEIIIVNPPLKPDRTKINENFVCNQSSACVTRENVKEHKPTSPPLDWDGLEPAERGAIVIQQLHERTGTDVRATCNRRA